MRLFSISYVLISVSIALPVYGQTTVTAGEDIVSGYLNKGKYDLSMSGDVSWNTVYTYAAGNTNNLTIDGNGHRITFGPSTGVYFNFNRNNGSLAINDAMVGTQTFASARDSLFWIGASGITTNLDFNGTTFQNIGPTNYNLYASANYGPIISQRVNSVTNINGGKKGVTFLGNHGLADQPGTIGISSGTMNFYNNVTFNSNWSANYSGAMAIYSDAPATVNFNGTTSFHNNHTGHYGGAIDMWGGNGSLVFNGDASFTDNYTYSVQNTTQDFPNHYTDRSASGGAIHVGFLASSGATGTSITFNDDVNFDGNFVNDLKTNAYNNAQGGAIGLNQSRETGNRNYNLYLNGNSVFNNNYVYSANGNGLGGAIFLNAQTGSVNIAGEAEFTNNTAKSLGGAIYVRKGTLNINANKGDVVFKGNRQGATFVSENRTLDTGNSYIFYKPVEGTGTPNSIYWETSNALTLNGTQGNAIRFYDPLALVAGATLILDQNGTGETVFYGDNGKSTAFDTDINVNTNINSGTFTVADGVNYGRTTYGTFNLKNSATLKGENSGTLKAATINLNSGSGIAVAGGTLLLDSANIALGNTAGGVVNLSGYGTVNSSSTLNTGYAGTTVNANIGLDESSSPGLLRLEAPVSGTTKLVKNGQGTLLLPTVQNYSDGTIVNEGVLMLAENGTLGKGNVTINTNGTLQIDSPFSGNYNFGNVLLGNGLLKVGLASGTNTIDFSNITGTGFAGTLELDDSFFSLAGNNTTVLGKSTLRLNSGNTTNVGAGEQIIGNLQVNGGLLRFPNMPTGVIRTDVLTLDSGTIQVNADTSVISTKSLLVQDDSDTNQLLVRANAVQGAASDLVLQNLSGSVASGVVQSDVEQEGNTVAVASYAYGLKSISDSPGNNGLFTSYRLTELELKDGQTLTLSGDAEIPAGANDMKAKITGNGNLAINATDRIVLANADNDYTGTTSISHGILQLGASHSFGNTGLLDIGTGAAVDLNDNNQIVGALGGEGSLKMNHGRLDIADGGNFGGVISGDTGVLNVERGTLVLTGDNTYTGTTTVASGTLQVGNGSTSGNYTGDIASNGTVVFNRSDDTVYRGIVSGSGNMVKEGSGVLVLTGDNIYTGGTTVVAGELHIGNGGKAGSITGDIANEGAVVFNRSDDIVYSGVIHGNGSLGKKGDGILTLSGNNDYSGGSYVNAGILLLDRENAAGTGNVNLASSTKMRLDFDNGVFDNVVVGGTDTIVSVLGNSIALGADNSAFSGIWKIDGSTLISDPDNLGGGSISLGGVLNVNARKGNYLFGNMLGGSGIMNVAMASPDDVFGFAATANGNFNGTIVFNDSRFVLSGINTQILSDATLQLNVGNITTVGSGQQNIDKLVLNGGSLVWDGFTSPEENPNGMISTNDLELDGGQIRIDVATNGMVNPPLAGSNSLLEQDDGNVMSQLVATRNLTGDISSIRLADLGGNVLDEGQVVAVTENGVRVADASYNYGLSTGDGNDGIYLYYGLTELELKDGQTLTLSGDASTPAGSNDMKAKITGSGNLAISATDRIILANSNNDYRGSTTVSEGTLQLGTDHALGETGELNIHSGAKTDINGKDQKIGALNGEGELDINRGNLEIAGGGEFGGVISGSAGTLALSGGTLTLTGENTYKGEATVTEGILQIGNGGTSGSYAGDITNSGTVGFNRSDDIVYDGVIAGSGNFVKEGNGTLILTGNNDYAGGTSIDAGTLQIGDGGTTGSVAGNISNDGKLVFNRSDDVAYGGIISGNGSLVKVGSGELTLTGDHTYTGTTSVDTGILRLGDGGTSGSVSGNIVNAGVVVFNRADNLEYDGIISGTGQMQQSGDGTVTFTGKNTYGGGTLISDGTVRLTGKGSIGSGVVDIASQGTLFIDNPDGDTYTFDNRLEGDGKLRVTLESSSDTFDFSHSVGSGFGGEVELDSGSMILGDTNSSALSQATLELGKNGSVTLDGDRSIGNLTFSGGQLNTTLGNGTDVDVLTVGYLNVDAKESPTVPGTVNYKGSASLNPDPDRSGNLLLQGDVNAENSIAIVRADAVSSAGTQLNLLMDGVVPADKTVVTNDGFGNNDLRATYGYMAVITDNKTENMTGLFGGYVLKTLESTTNAILDSATAPDANFGTKLTGSGDFEFRAHDNSITLLNAANDYSGQTTVTSGTLNMGANDVFGHTSALNIRETATVNMNGFRQNIGELNGETGSTLDLGGGDLTITAGGKSNGDLSGSGYLHLSGGTLTVANANEKLDAVIDLQSGATARLQSVKGLGNGNINLSGNLQLSGAQGTMENRLEGTGIVSLTNGSNVGFSADNADFSGSFHISSGTTLSATSDSQLGTATVTNEGNLVLHSDDDWKFDNVMNGSGKLVKVGEGIVRISSEYAHEGGTEIMHGSLVMDSLSSALSGSGDVRIAEGASLGGYGLIGGNVINQGILAAGNGMAVLTKGTGTLTISGSLTNSGSIHLGGDDAGNVLRVKGDYFGSGSLVMNTVLGDDSSVTDKLIVEGNTSGSTAVMLNNAGGVGNATHNGIQIVQVDGISDGEFHLGNRVVQGAYDYRLYKGSVDNPDDGDWYLRSTRNDAGTAPIRPEVGAYLANRDAALTMFRHTLQERTGNSQFLESAVAGENAEAFWGYVEADYGTGRSAGQIDQRRWGNRIQVGSDIFRSAENINNWRVGVMAGYGTVRSRSLTDGQVYRADSDLTGYSAGVYATWYSDARKRASGPYLDSWLQHSWFKNQVKGEELDENRYNSRAWSGSLEGGWTFDAYTDKDYHVYVQPQAQIVYTRYHANDVVESNGTVIENRHKNGISTRLGTRIFGYSRGKDTRWQPYAELNWWHNQKTSMIRIEDENFDSGLPNDIAELKAGFEVMLNENVNAWAQMRLQKGEKSYKSVGGFAGVRINW